MQRPTASNRGYIKVTKEKYETTIQFTDYKQLQN